MKNRYTIVLILSVCWSLLFFQCNTEKFLGYKYDAPLPDNEVLISGKVVNTFTDLPVSNANIEINRQTTVTNFLFMAVSYPSYPFTKDSCSILCGSIIRCKRVNTTTNCNTSEIYIQIQLQLDIAESDSWRAFVIRLWFSPFLEL